MKFTSCIMSAVCGALFLFAGASALGNGSNPVSGKKPNIIVFLVDDMGWQDTSHPFWSDSQGNPKKTFLNRRYRTPNMEKLASQGMTFTDAYAHPLCTPSRVSLMSGMNPARHRVTCWVREQNGTTDANSRSLLPPDWAHFRGGYALSHDASFCHGGYTARDAEEVRLCYRPLREGPFRHAGNSGFQSVEYGI